MDHLPHHQVCASCKRHLLRGEDSETFLHDGQQLEVCALCVPRALHAGWIRVGAFDAPTLLPEQRRSRAQKLTERLFKRRAQQQPIGPTTRRVAKARQEAAAAEALYDRGHESAVESVQPIGGAEPQSPEQQRPPAEALPSRSETPVARSSAPPRKVHRIEDEVAGLNVAEEELAAPLAQQTTTEQGAPAQVATAGMRMSARAVELFNASNHPRMLQGVARTLGAPWVTIRRAPNGGAAIMIIIAWELTWYRFSMDLANESAGVKLDGHGSALADLTAEDVQPNAVADERGLLYLNEG